MNKIQIEDLYLRYLSGEKLREEEMDIVKEWIKKNNKNKEYLEQLHKAAKATEISEQLKSIDVENNWIRYQETIAAKNLEGIDQSFSRNNKIIFLRIAAAIIFLVAITTVLYMMKFQSRYSIQQSSVDRITEIMLSDGSTILLNSGSALAYPKEFHSKRREVELTGEAYFDITHKKNIPFYVYMDRLTLQVLGTSFTIKEKENGNTVVNVFTGKVVFYEKKHSDNSIQLSAGQKGTFNNNTREFKKDSLDAVSTFFWNADKLNFKNQPLTEVFDILEEVFQKTIIVVDEEILENKLNSKCKGLDLDEILDELSILFPIQYVMKEDTVYIQKAHE